MLWAHNARVLATFAVVVLHVSVSVIAGVENTNSFDWWIGNIYDSSFRWGVPVFVMLSGLLLLDPSKEEPIIIFYKKRTSKILIPIIFWTLCFSALSWFGIVAIGVEPHSIFTLIKRTLAGVPYYHLWYLYMILGLYLFTPYLRKIIRESTYKKLLFLCILLFALSLAKTAVDSYQSVDQISAIFSFVYYLPYFLAGYLIHKTKIKPNIWILLTLFALSFIATAIGFYFSVTNDGLYVGGNMYFHKNLSITIVIMSISLMFLLKRLSRPIISASISRKLALLSLGVYIIHPIFMERLRIIGIQAESYSPVFSIPIITIVVFFLSLLAATIISKIPMIKKII